MPQSGTTKVHTRYRTKEGKLIPGVTTVLSLLAKPALIHWAWKLGIEGEDYKKVKERAADIGTVVHYLVECSIKGSKPDLGDYSPNTVDAARLAFRDFAEWRGKQNLKTEGCEVSLISENWAFGGTLDWVAVDMDTGLRWLFDVKTSKGVFIEMHYQLAAYKFMWMECNPGKPIDRAGILLLNKADGTFTLHPLGDLVVEFEIFKHLRAVYALQKQGDPNRDRDRGYRKVAGSA